MFNVEETISLLFSYVSQRDIFLKLILFSVGSFFVLDLLRSQSVEIDLLQLTPGLYLAFVFLTYIVLFICSRIFLELSFRVDNEKATGTKSLLRSYVIISRKINVFFSSMSLFFSLTILLPISLEYFINSIQKTLENLWSLQEFLGIELIFFVLCTFLFQFPIFFTAPNYVEQKIAFFQQNFKNALFITSILAALITPTVDLNTQLVISGIIFILYLVIQFIFQKQVLLQISNLSLSSFYSFSLFLNFTTSPVESNEKFTTETLLLLLSCISFFFFFFDFHSRKNISLSNLRSTSI